jgi:D-3-phosphoglycerate dehydrogenase
MTSAPVFRVGYLEQPMNRSFLDTLDGVAGIEAVRIMLADGDTRVGAALAGCQGYYVRAARDELPAAWHVTADLLARQPQLLIVASYGAGYDTIDAAACTAVGVAVVNQAGGNAEGVAEHALGMMLSLLKRMPEAGAAMRAGTVGARDAFLGRELIGRTVGLVGLGHVGRRVAELLRIAFRCRVLAVDPFLPDAAFAEAGVERVQLPALLAQSHIVSLHCPLDATTRGMIGAAEFAAMRPGAIFVSTARGGIHDEAALLAALQSGHIAGAGLDVWEREPPPASHGLLAHARVISTPHTAGVTQESRSRVGSFAAEAFIAVSRGQVPPRLVNPEVTERFLARLAASRAG